MMKLPRPLTMVDLMFVRLRALARRRDRRGVLLLVVLSLLALFAMIGVTFLLVAGQYRRSSRAAGRAEQYGDDPRLVLDSIFAQVVRDTTNGNSSVQNHSLLEDMYGTDGLRGTISNATPVGGASLPTPFIDIISDVSALFGGYPFPSASSKATPGYFNGCVLTMSDGPAAGFSTRIVGWSMLTGTTATIRIVAFPGCDATKLTAANLTGKNFIINGRAFSGPGFGFNSANGRLDLTDAGSPIPTVPVGLQPNCRYNRSPFNFAGGDEEYDAPDLQNIALAYIPLNPTQSAHILPSFHRPDLAAFLQNRFSAEWSNASGDLQRRAILRPLGKGPATGIVDHPEFTGSNSSVNATTAFNPINGPWDIDNDGDGIPDSIWIDVGMPVQTAPDGRRFKPLAAIMVVDLDGRLNVNAHGTIAQSNAQYSQAIPIGSGSLSDYLYSNTGSPTAVTLPKGSGYGPAEINLGLAGIFANATTDYAQFFNGKTASSRTYEGRYGQYGTTSPGAGNSAGNSADDVLAAIKRINFPANYYTATNSNYGTPSDLWGRAAMGIDYAGQPIWSFLNTASSTYTLGSAMPDTPNDPYTLNLSLNRARMANSTTPTTNDNPFTVGELEAILRRFDIDASTLPARLQSLLTGGVDLARLVTTESFDVPSPSTHPTKDLAALIPAALGVGTVAANVHVVDLFRARLVANGVTTVSTQNTMIANLLPPDVVAGLRFDLNRPFGNGADDDANGVVDEPDEYTYSNTNEAPASWTSAFGAAVKLDLNNDGATNALDLNARAQYAKYLYTLMMLFVDPNNQYAWATETPALSVAEQQEITARRIAQWAINAVDFRDSDAIMTPFEYDINPFNDGVTDTTKAVDGILGSGDDTTSTERRLVWGVEYPELIITETLATHDRRVKDTAAGNGKRGNPAGAGPDKDPTLDQVRVPEGSLFVELYCPRNGNSSIPLSAEGYPAELYKASGVGTQPQLNLSAMAPAAGGANATPVWRMVVVGNKTAAAQNDLVGRFGQQPESLTFDPVPTSGGDPRHHSIFDPSNSDGQVIPERIIWFASDQAAATGNPDTSKIYFNKQATPTPNLLNPGQYAVVGPRATTYLGLKSDGTLAPQKITLDTAAPKVTYTPSNSLPPNEASTDHPALPIICVSSSNPAGWTTNVGVSVSEPLFSNSYYSAPNANGPSGVQDTYTPARDVPLDSATNLPAALTTGPHMNFKTVVLQRLANPLVVFNETTNPYITVDWMPIDLTTFNGEALQDTAYSGPGNFDPDDPGYFNPPATLIAGQGVGGVERGANGTVGSPDLWNTTPKRDTTGTSRGPTAAPSPVFNYNLNQTIGFINKSMSTPWASPPTTTPKNYGYVNAPDPTKSAPFSWLTWNNRPYTSNMELMLVPATSAEQLLRIYSSTASPGNPYDRTTATTAFATPFRHLLNFNVTGDGTNTTTTPTPYFYRVLEYLQVPSRFNGTDSYLKPSQFANPLPSGGGLTEAQLMSFYHPPFNKVSNFRDPGKVNINTIAADPTGTNSPTWNAILNGGPGPAWADIVANRRGYGTSGQSVLLANNTFPSFFTNPFRSAGGFALMPPGMATPPVTTEIDVTLMREDRNNPGRPLFNLLAAPGPYMNPDRNAAFRYSPLTRLSNLITTRSNVYAVWITVGYFETTPIAISTTYPDGVQLGRELGSDSGEIKRHRGFYIYDRTIPVGYEPGQNHNYENGILLKRFIE